MSEKHEIKTGDTAMLKVGRNEVKVKILNPMAGSSAFMVKSLSSGKVFMVQSRRLTMSGDDFEPEMEKTQNPAPEAAPIKRLSLMDAAVVVLQESGKPMNTREMVKAAIEKGYWSPTVCKTPEQTLYSSIFREIKTKEHPRIVKSEHKGKFRLG